jgi:hypothetical protein
LSDRTYIAHIGCGNEQAPPRHSDEQWQLPSIRALWKVFRIAFWLFSVASRHVPVLRSDPMNFGRFYRFWFYASPKPLAEGLGTT